MTAKLAFMKNDGDEDEGLNDPGIETFRDTPYSSVARETGQNSRDERVDETKPVKMTFRRIEVPAAEFPEIDGYREAVRICLQMAKKSGDTKELSFFGQAQTVLNRETISVLEIADYNTGGLKGPCVKGTPYHALVKATGVSAKDLDTAGGSFGIGKNAVFAASDLQTAFYSTIYLDDAGPKFLCQGKTRFRSFKGADGSEYRSIGYWGDPDRYQPIEDPNKVPEWLRRDVVGTSIYSIAMRDSEDWEAELIASLLMNFFVAIHREDMEFEVGSERINASTLLYKFEETRIKEAATRAGYSEDFQFARDLYDSLRTEDDTFSIEFDVPGVGDFRVRLAVKEGLPRRIAFIRNGMFITDSLEKFDDKLRRFPMFREFSALVEPVGEKEVIWLRSLENPRHDMLSADRLTNPDEREAARIAGRKLAKAVRDAIKSKAKSEVGAETELEELSEFFALEERAEEAEEGDRDPYSFKVKKQVKPKKVRKTKPPVSEDEGEEGGASQEDENESDGGNGGTGPGEGEGTGGKGKRAVRLPMPLLNPRTQLPDSADPRRRIVRFTPEKSGPAILKFQALGLNKPENLPVTGGDIAVNCTAGERHEVEVTFELPYGGPVEIVSWLGGSSDEAQ